MMKVLHILFQVFFAICIAVHVNGLFFHPSGESNLSHCIHLVCYIVCLVCFLFKFKLNLLLLVLASLYPFSYHAHYFVMELVEKNTIDGICILVTFLIPVGIFLLVNEKLSD